MRARSFVRPVVAFLAAVLTACSAAPGADPAATEDDFTATDFPADQVLPYADGWVDAPRALAGVGQFDRLKGTIYDDAKCSTMVAVAAAIVGGEERFMRFLDHVAAKREGRREDLATVDGVRAAVREKRLTPRHLHELTEAVVRAHALRYGAYDEQIAEMIVASGYAPVKLGVKEPHALVDGLREREVVPLGILAPDGDALIPHITLLWKDDRGVVRLYDSDDVGGSHVMPRGSAAYRDRMNREGSGWELAEKYR